MEKTGRHGKLRFRVITAALIAAIMLLLMMILWGFQINEKK